MVRIYKSSDVPLIEGGGYSRKYNADIEFKVPLDSAGFIQVFIPEHTKTQPHAHTKLEEVFVIMNRSKMGVGIQIFELEKGDIIVVEPGEAHWFETYPDQPLEVIAIKCPNLEGDKVVPE